MAKLSRRQFLGATAGAAAAVAPHIWVRPGWAQQQKELKILTWSHFVPDYDKWLDQFVPEWGAKNGIKATVDHIPHLQHPGQIAAEVAAHSGHNGVLLIASGTEKFAPARRDVQDLA